MRAKHKHHPFVAFIRILFGWAFILAGLAGLVLPFLQGLLFLAIGALLLAPFIPFFRRLKIMIYRRFPRVRRSIERTKDRILARLPKRFRDRKPQ